MDFERRRNELGLTYQEIAERVGVTRSTVRKWEKGIIKNIGSNKIVPLAQVLEISVYELLRKEEG